VKGRRTVPSRERKEGGICDVYLNTLLQLFLKGGGKKGREQRLTKDHQEEQGQKEPGGKKVDTPPLEFEQAAYSTLRLEESRNSIFEEKHSMPWTRRGGGTGQKKPTLRYENKDGTSVAGGERGPRL